LSISPKVNERNSNSRIECLLNENSVSVGENSKNKKETKNQSTT